MMESCVFTTFCIALAANTLRIVVVITPLPNYVIQVGIKIIMIDQVYL